MIDYPELTLTANATVREGNNPVFAREDYADVTLFGGSEATAWLRVLDNDFSPNGGLRILSFTQPETAVVSQDPSYIPIGVMSVDTANPSRDLPIESLFITGSEGVHTFSYTVIDAEGYTAEASVTVKILPYPRGSDEVAVD